MFNRFFGGFQRKGRPNNNRNHNTNTSTTRRSQFSTPSSKSNHEIPLFVRRRTFNKKVGLSLCLGASLLAVSYSFFKKTYAESERVYSEGEQQPNEDTPQNVKKEEQKQGQDQDQEEEKEKYYDYVIVGSSMAAKLIISTLISTKSEATILWVHENENTTKYPLSDNGIDFPQAYIDWQEKMRTMCWKPDDPEDIDKISINNLYFLSSKKKELVFAGHPITKFGKCVLAYSSVPKRLHNNKDQLIPLPSNSSHIIHCNSISDLDKLHYLASQKAVKHITVIGDTLLALDVAMGLSFLAKNKNMEVAQVIEGNGVLDNLFPKYFSDFTTQQLTESGVKIHKNAGVTDIIDLNEPSKPESSSKGVGNADESKVVGADSLIPYTNSPTYNVVLDNGDEIKTNLLIVAQGSESSTDCTYLCSVSEFETKKSSISVNNQLLIADDIWGAGDSINVWLPEHKRRRIQDIEQQYMSAMTVIDNMEGKHNLFSSIPSYLTNFFGRSIAIFGSPDSSAENVGVWSKTPLLLTSGKADEDFEKTENYDTGAIYYLNEDKAVTGLILVNLPPFAIPQAKAMFRRDRLFLNDREFMTGITFKEEQFTQQQTNISEEV